MVQCWFNMCQELDEKTQPILWTEWPTGALVGKKWIVHRGFAPPAHSRVFGSCRGNLVGHFAVVAHLCVTGAATVSFLGGAPCGPWNYASTGTLSEVDNTFMVRHLDEMGLGVAHFAGCSWFGFSKGFHFAGFCWYVFPKGSHFDGFASLSPLLGWVFVL